MLRSEHKIYKDEQKSPIPNTSEIELDKDTLSMDIASLKHNLHMVVKLQHSQAPRHVVVTNAELMEQVLYSI